MAVTQPFSVTFSMDLADAVERKVGTGEHPSTADVPRAGVEALLDRIAAFERWLRDDVIAGHAEYVAGPGKAVTADELLARLAAST